MSFTEIVVEVGDPRSPVVRATRAAPETFVVARVLDDGQPSRRYRVLVACHGPSSVFSNVARDLRAMRPRDEVEVAFEGPDLLTLVVSTSLSEGFATMGFTGLPLLLREAGLDGLLDPIVVRDGHARVRLLVARQLEPQEALRGLQEVQRALGAHDFRVLRVGAVTAAEQVQVIRRLLPPEQEDLLRLAASMGYYETPKRSTLDTIAQRVALSISPVHKRLKAAEETLVGAHVQPLVAQAGARRRGRAERVGIEPSQPWEVLVRVRAPDFGPSHFAASVGEGAILWQPTGEDHAAGVTRHLVAGVLPEDLQMKLLSSLEGRAEVSQVQVVGRERGCVVARVEARGRSGFGMTWWTDIWGGDAVLRPVLFEGADATLRILLARPHTEESFAARLAESARAGLWSEHEVLHARPLGGLDPPPPMAEPLTTRQVEVLRVAHALGYYQTPRGTTLEGVAKTLGVSANAIHKNLVLAEAKIITGYLNASY